LDESIRVGLEMGGTITGEHGVGQYKLRWLGLEQPEPVRELQRRIKELFDPAGILNPGKAIWGGWGGGWAGTGRRVSLGWSPQAARLLRLACSTLAGISVSYKMVFHMARWSRLVLLFLPVYFPPRSS